MFDFERWSEFVSQSVPEFQKLGFKADYRSIVKPVAKGHLEIQNQFLLATYTLWDSGLADFDIMNTKSKEFVIHDWGRQLDDGTFEPEFQKFKKLCTEYRD